MIIRFTAFLSVLVCIVSSAAFAEEFRFRSIVMTDVWARATDGTESAIFMKIRNDGGDDKLTWVMLPFGGSETVEVVDGDVKLIDSIPVYGDGTVTELSPVSRYVMALVLTKPLREGMQIPITIDFWDTGRFEIMVPVRASVPRRVAKCQSESLFECGKQRSDREFERRKLERNTKGQ